jgi:hypothetical protein
MDFVKFKLYALIIILSSFFLILRFSSIHFTPPALNSGRFLNIDFDGFGSAIAAISSERRLISNNFSISLNSFLYYCLLLLSV